MHPQEPRTSSHPSLPDRGPLRAGLSLLLGTPGCSCPCPHGRANAGQMSTVCTECPAVTDRWPLSVSTRTLMSTANEEEKWK